MTDLDIVYDWQYLPWVRKLFKLQIAEKWQNNILHYLVIRTSQIFLSHDYETWICGGTLCPVIMTKQNFSSHVNEINLLIKTLYNFFSPNIDIYYFYIRTKQHLFSCDNDIYYLITRTLQNFFSHKSNIYYLVITTK